MPVLVPHALTPLERNPFLGAAFADQEPGERKAEIDAFLGRLSSGAVLRREILPSPVEGEGSTSFRASPLASPVDPSPP
ncbi:hypothetical protein SAMN05444320_105196 [Streptoalloteichus hindustanus]|uniref:Uncharacterized protein n=1 Tax=Streptoalloteichus hindustanus TaxID=2017 RepID=A0A1M5EYU9_STRHI|nr:hypothetical protein SAMN05444320_105196 [Streptoalloteichus hindustanus]